MVPVVAFMILATLATSMMPSAEAYYKQNLTEGEQISNGQYLMVPDISSQTLVPPWLAMQRDCNFVLYNQAGVAVWNTVTETLGVSGSCYATVKDCNILVYSGMGSSVLYNSSTGGAGATPPCVMTILLNSITDDPAAVLYDSANKQIWSSGLQS